MIPSSLLAEPIVLVKRTPSGEDEYGDETTTEDRVDTKAYMQPFRAAEDTANVDQQTDVLRAFLSPEVDPTGYDAIERGDGSVYEIEGPPGPCFRAWPPVLQHYELLAQRVV